MLDRSIQLSTSAMTRVPAMRTLENALRRVGFVHVAGVDEVGRGCLAGPVVAAAVVLHPDRHIPGVCDSKMVPAAERERLYERILRTRSPGRSRRPIRPKSIASTSTRRRCARCSAPSSRWRRCPTSCSSTRSACPICRWRSAACRTATAAARRSPRRRSSPKVTRDRQMLELHGRDPRYGFDRHKGYATADHLDAVARFGYSDVHRRSFRPADAV